MTVACLKFKLSTLYRFTFVLNLVHRTAIAAVKTLILLVYNIILPICWSELCYLVKHDCSNVWHVINNWGSLPVNISDYELVWYIGNSRLINKITNGFNKKQFMSFYCNNWLFTVCKTMLRAGTKFINTCSR